MFEREFITFPRAGDEEPMSVRISEVAMFAPNANESGVVEGTVCVYLKSGLALAVNATHEEVMAAIHAAGVQH